MSRQIFIITVGNADWKAKKSELKELEKQFTDALSSTSPVTALAVNDGVKVEVVTLDVDNSAHPSKVKVSVKAIGKKAAKEALKEIDKKIAEGDKPKKAKGAKKSKK